jgi:hypothetical protein
MGRKKRFNTYDLVRVAKDLGVSMKHFTSDCNAIVLKCNNSGNRYSIYIEGQGDTSWYEEDQLTLIASNQEDLLSKWRLEARREYIQLSKLNWIFTNGKSVISNPHEASVVTLGRCINRHFSEEDLWGSRGEGITYYFNMLNMVEIAKPFLETGDKKGWLEHCKNLRNNKY